MTPAPVLDLPRGVRRTLITAGCAGVVLVVSGSLLGKGHGSIGIDKLIHLSAYTGLSTVLVLGLPLRRAVVGLLLLASASYGVELLQPYNGRSRDFLDAWANTAGVTLGAGLGLVARWTAGRLWTELQALRMRRNLRVWDAGERLFAHGDTLRRFWVIRDGTVDVVGRGGTSVRGPGDVLGLGAELLDAPSDETATARTRTEAWELDIETLIHEGGGDEQPLAAVLRALVRQERAAERPTGTPSPQEPVRSASARP